MLIGDLGSNAAAGRYAAGWREEGQSRMRK